eukprot:SAG31_NODE_414_length_15953_cov_2.982528_9_plen_259_part_00
MHARGGSQEASGTESDVVDGGARAQQDRGVDQWEYDPVEQQRRQTCGMMLTIFAFGVLFTTLSVSGAPRSHASGQEHPTTGAELTSSGGVSTTGGEGHDHVAQTSVAATFAVWFSLTAPVLVIFVVVVATIRRRWVESIERYIGPDGFDSPHGGLAQDIEVGGAARQPAPLPVSTMCVIQNPGGGFGDDAYALGEEIRVSPRGPDVVPLVVATGLPAHATGETVEMTDLEQETQRNPLRPSVSGGIDPAMINAPLARP